MCWAVTSLVVTTRRVARFTVLGGAHPCVSATFACAKPLSPALMSRASLTPMDPFTLSLGTHAGSGPQHVRPTGASHAARARPNIAKLQLA